MDTTCIVLSIYLSSKNLVFKRLKAKAAAEAVKTE